MKKILAATSFVLLSLCAYPSYAKSLWLNCEGSSGSGGSGTLYGGDSDTYTPATEPEGLIAEPATDAQSDPGSQVLWK